MASCLPRDIQGSEDVQSCIMVGFYKILRPVLQFFINFTFENDDEQQELIFSTVSKNTNSAISVESLLKCNVRPVLVQDEVAFAKRLKQIFTF